MIILPNGQGLLHKLASASETSLGIGNITSLASELFDLSKNKKEYFLKNVDGPVRVEIPILKDIKKKTPLDKCLDVKKLENKD